MYLTFLSCADLAIKGVQSFMKDNSLASADEIAEVVVNQQMASALKSTNKTNIVELMRYQERVKADQVEGAHRPHERRGGLLTTRLRRS